MFTKLYVYITDNDSINVYVTTTQKEHMQCY